MSVSIGPKITTNGLIMFLDSTDPNSLLSTVEVLVVAGGGGGGFNAGAGGGAGGLIYRDSYTVSPGTAYTVTVGAGGSGRTSDVDSTSNAGNSVFNDLTAIAGGAGCNSNGSGPGQQPPTSGGSGGGAATSSTPGSGTSGQGFAGGAGNGQDGALRAGGGGGGAGEVGQATVSSTNGGNGGTGKYLSQFTNNGSPSGWFAGGGGGSSHYPGVTPQGGNGGGGNGGFPNYPSAGTAGVAGTANTGGGGGAGAGGGYPGGAGGSGIVIVRYPGSQKATGGTVTFAGGYTLHTFTSVGSSSFTPNATWYDISGNSNHGTINSGEFSTANKGYLQNSGNVTNFFYISIPDSTSISAAFSPAGGGWTIEETVYTYSVNYPESDAGTVVSNQAYSAGNIGFDWNHGVGNTQFVFGQSNNSASGYNDQPTISLNAPYSNLNYWKLRSMIWDRSSNTVSLYINGVFQGVASTPNTAGKTIYDGGGISLGTLYGWKHFGRRSLVRVYNRILTATEIDQNYQAIKTRYDI
jgi:hypothetical protein